ncbi:hypothetical protein HLI_21410 (plasmid) [Halobacillus litoralis]|uniref:Uncharacterized protein n=2 Tax=Halobacillus litoralis TaxID=45668 RepID=A0A410MJ96_9BACI|nr:hypothetical protein HLI_21410 [Halobacillus litoralis]
MEHINSVYLRGFFIKEEQMKDKTFFVKTGINGRGVGFSHHEMELLKVLANQKLLTGDLMRRYYETAVPISKDGMRKRLAKWESKKIINLHDMTEGKNYRFGNPYKRVTIANRGLNFLREHGYLDDDEYEDAETSLINIDFQDHYFCTQNLAIELMVRLKNRGVDFESINPIKEFGKNRINEKIELIPDWLLKSKDKNFYIETDTATETQSIIKSKVERYIKVAELEPECTHIVFFSVIDDSADTLHIYSEHREKRVANIKQTLLNMPGIHMKNLHVIVTQQSRSYDVAERSLISPLPLTNDFRQYEMQVAILALEQNESFNYEIKELEMDDFVFKGLEEEFYPDGIFEIANIAGTKRDNVAFVHMNEASANSMDRLNILSKCVRDSRFTKRVDRIIAFYSGSEELKRDVFGCVFDNVLISSQQDWAEEGRGGREPSFYKTKSNYRLEVTSFGE